MRATKCQSNRCQSHLYTLHCKLIYSIIYYFADKVISVGLEKVVSVGLEGSPPLVSAPAGYEGISPWTCAPGRFDGRPALEWGLEGENVSAVSSLTCPRRGVDDSAELETMARAIWGIV